MEQTKQEKRKSTIAWVMTIIVTVVAILSVVIGIYTLTQGYDSTGNKLTWFSIIAIVLGAVAAVLSAWTFSHAIETKAIWWSVHVTWTLCAIGLIVIGVIASIYINSKGGLVWLPICVTINGGILLGDKIQYLIVHFDKLNKQTQENVQ